MSLARAKTRVTCGKCQQSFDVVGSSRPGRRSLTVGILGDSFDRSKCFEPQASDDLEDFECPALHESLWEAFATRH
jgi:hypothetical protein